MGTWHRRSRASSAATGPRGVTPIAATSASQEFARVYRIALATLKNWEQGRRQPNAPAAAYLQVIAKRPREAREALAS
jgi:hypothetical protein